jgi:ubiquinone/menaquinone biosynthesis C-methylase UbiE
MSVLQYDEEASKKLLAVYTTPDVERQRQEVLEAIDLQLNEKVLDVGSGPGFLSRAIADKTGPEGRVMGIDISDYLIQLAKSHNDDLPQIEFKLGDAAAIASSDEEFDTLVCTQVLEYVQDVDAALIEFNRVLKKGGKLAILDTDWDSIVWNSNNAKRMHKVLKAWEAHATFPFLPRTLSSKMSNAGFQLDQIKIIPLLNPFFTTESYSNRMIDLIVSFVVQNDLIEQAVAEDWARDLRNQENYFFSLNRYLFLGYKA